MAAADSRGVAAADPASAAAAATAARAVAAIAGRQPAWADLEARAGRAALAVPEVLDALAALVVPAVSDGRRRRGADGQAAPVVSAVLEAPVASDGQAVPVVSAVLEVLEALDGLARVPVRGVAESRAAATGLTRATSTLAISMSTMIGVAIGTAGAIIRSVPASRLGQSLG